MLRKIVRMLLVAVLTVNLVGCGLVTGPPSPEKEILVESISTGAIVGGVIGATVFGLATQDEWATAAGGVIGALLGSVVGRIVGDCLLDDVKDLELENDKITALLDQAKTYNHSIAEENKILAQQLKDIKQNGQDKETAYALGLERAKETLEGVQERIAERERFSSMLVAEQSAPYKKTIEALKKEQENLEKIIHEYEEEQEAYLA